VIKFFLETGVKMDIFYRLLWRHVFVVEILKTRFHIESEDSKKSFIDVLWRLVPKNKKHEMALDYLRDWGESFWKETEFRIKEVTTKLEDELKGSIEGAVPGLGKLSASAARTLSEEEREEVINRAQDVVNR
jgi:predicted CopG family antitoxin